MASKNVLWIASDESLLDAHRRKLTSFGFSILTASRSDEALTTLASVPLDAIILDGSMPEADCESLPVTIKQMKPRIPVILLGVDRRPGPSAAVLVDAFIRRESDDLSPLLGRLDSLIKIRTHSHSELQQEYVVFADTLHRYLDCSEGVCQLLGYARMELLGMTIEDVSYSTDDVSVLFEQFVKRREQDGDYILRHQTGMPVPIRYHAYIFEDGCIAAVWEPSRGWKERYASALVELNPVKLEERVEAAYAAIEARRQELTKLNQKASAEWQSLQDALVGIASLRREFIRRDKN